jgi:hypothetical protein
MANETPAGLLTVGELRQALDEADRDQIVVFALTSQEIANLEAPGAQGLAISFAVRVDRAGVEGPVFRLAPARPWSPPIG